MNKFYRICLKFTQQSPDQKKITDLQRQVEVLTKIIAARELEIRNLRQIREALGDENRLYAAEALKRPVTEKEAIAHYFSHNGPEHFALSWAIHSPGASENDKQGSAKVA